MDDLGESIWWKEEQGERILPRLDEMIEGADCDFLVFTQTFAPIAQGLQKLDSKGFNYIEVNLDNFDGLRKEVVEMTGHRTVPVVLI